MVQNIIVVALAPHVDQQQMLETLKAHGILAVGFGAGKLRFVTHLDVSETMVKDTIEILKEID